MISMTGAGRFILNRTFGLDSVFNDAPHFAMHVMQRHPSVHVPDVMNDNASLASAVLGSESRVIADADLSATDALNGADARNADFKGVSIVNNVVNKLHDKAAPPVIFIFGESMGPFSCGSHAVFVSRSQEVVRQVNCTRKFDENPAPCVRTICPGGALC